MRHDDTSRVSIALDGIWDIRFDADNRGKEQGWYSTEALAWEESADGAIEVPSCWEELRPGYDGVAWYHRRFSPEPGSRRPGDRFTLRFGAVNYLAEVWLNGEFMGAHEGGYTPFELDVSDHLVDGPNELVVRVLDPPKNDVDRTLGPDEEGIDGIVLKETPCWREFEAFNFGGIWQSIELLRRPPVHMASCFVQPLLDRDAVRVDLEVTSLATATTSARLRIAVTPNAGSVPPIGEVVSHVEIVPGANRVALEVPLASPTRWSPQNPYLYDCQVDLRTADGVVDACAERFGFREFTIRDNRFCLNGDPIFVKGGFHEGLYPRTIAYPTSREMAREEIRVAKEAGFNLLRFWQIPLHPTVLDAADELGMMICEEPPIEWIKDSPHLRRRCTTEVRELVLRDRNRPCVAMWTILNESSHFIDLRRISGLTVDEWLDAKQEHFRSTQIQQIKDELCLLARSLDPTRVIIDDSGGWVGGANAYLPNSAHPIPLEDLHIYRPAPTEEATYQELHGLLSERGPVYLSEVGYGSIADLDAVIEAYRADGASRKAAAGSPSVAWALPEELEDYQQYPSLKQSLQRILAAEHLRHVFPNAAAFYRATQELQADGNRRQLEALRSNPACTGYVLHAFSAGGLILGAEVVDIWRRPKQPMLDALKRVHRPLNLILHASPSTLYADQPVRTVVTLANETGARGEATLSATVRRAVDAGASTSGADGHEPDETTYAVSAQRGVHVLLDAQRPAPSEPGTYEVEVVLRQGGATLADATERFSVMPPADLGAAPSVTIVDPLGVWRGCDHLNGLQVVSLDELGGAIGTDKDAAVVLCSPESWSDLRFREWVPRLLAWVESGGTAMLQGPFSHVDVGHARSLLPFDLCVRQAVGHWNPCVHYLRDHPLFEGMAVNRLMGPEYASVVPRMAFVDTDGDPIAGCISMNGDIWVKPNAFWWGATVLERPHGRGRLLLSQMRITDGVAASEPIAQRLLTNVLRYVTDQRAASGASTNASLKGGAEVVHAIAG